MTKLLLLIEAARRRAAQPSQAGVTLIELLVGVAIGGIVVAMTFTFFVHSSQQSQRAGKALDNETRRRVLAQDLSKLDNLAVQGTAWLNATVMGTLGLGGSPFAGLADAQGSVMVASGYKMTGFGPVSFSAVGGNYPQLVGFIRKDSAVPAVEVTATVNLNVSPNIQVTGTSGYIVGDTLAFVTPVGVQFLQVTAIGPTAFNVATLGAYTMPGGSVVPSPAVYMDAGTSIFRPMVSVAGVESAGYFQIIDFTRVGTKVRFRSDKPWPQLTSFLMNPACSTAFYGLIAFQPRQPSWICPVTGLPVSLWLRIQWQRALMGAEPSAGQTTFVDNKL